MQTKQAKSASQDSKLETPEMESSINREPAAPAGGMDLKSIREAIARVEA
ncbi:MAG: hypothetical protein JWM42_2134, partial [Burkholderia sp.]|nr:hypothetical protein [Burkholderia sp.]